MGAGHFFIERLAQASPLALVQERIADLNLYPEDDAQFLDDGLKKNNADSFIVKYLFRSFKVKINTFHFIRNRQNKITRNVTSQIIF